MKAGLRDRRDAENKPPFRLALNKTAQASLKTADGEPKYTAYPSDEASGSGKKFYHNVISGADFPVQPHYVAIATPVIPYCMGEIDVTSAGLGLDTQPVAGGVQDNNRLGGNSLLDCVAFGRVAGVACA